MLLIIFPVCLNGKAYIEKVLFPIAEIVIVLIIRKFYYFLETEELDFRATFFFPLLVNTFNINSMKYELKAKCIMSSFMVENSTESVQGLQRVRIKHFAVSCLMKI